MPHTSLLTRRALLKGAALAGAALLLPAPASLLAATEPLHTQSRVLLGTFVNITVRHDSSTLAQEAMGRAFEEIARLETVFTRHSSSSPLATLNAQGVLLDAPAELVELLARAQRVHGISRGAFDVTVAPLLELFSAHKNPQGALRLDPMDLAEARALIKAEEVHLAPDHVRLGRSGMALTLDGIAKGHIADKASQVLTAHGIHHHLVNAGGDIRAEGSKAEHSAWRVAVEHPAKSTVSGGSGGSVRRAQTSRDVAASLPLRGAIATSGCYEIYYDARGEHHHLIDPVLKQSPRHTLSVSVTAPTALEADALATALSVMPLGDGLRLLRSLPGREGCFILPDGHVTFSEGWPRA